MSFDESLQERLARQVSGVAIPRPETEFTPRSPGGRHPRTMEIHGVPVAIVDPHNEAFYFWALARRELREAPLLIHVDSHSDMASVQRAPFFKNAFDKPIEEARKDELWRYTRLLFINDFIEAGVVEGLIKPDAAWFDPWGHGGNLHWYRHQAPQRYAMDHMNCEEIRYGHSPSGASTQRLKSHPLVWDIDLDAFSLCNPSTPGKTLQQKYVDKRFNRTFEFLRHCGRPSLVTIAESQTPETYCPPRHLDYVTEKTLEMLEEVLR